jgi:hypothetical protein
MLIYFGWLFDWLVVTGFEILKVIWVFFGVSEISGSSQ